MLRCESGTATETAAPGGRWGSLNAGRDADAYRSLFERSGHGMMILDRGMQIQEANPAMSEQLYVDHDNVAGRSLLEFLHVSSHHRMRRLFSGLAEARSERIMERTVVLRGTSSDDALLSAVAVHGTVPLVSSMVVMLQFDDAHPAAPPPVDQEKLLTEMDASILEGIAAGISTVNMCGRVYLSRQGVEYHVSTMLRRFRVANRAALVSKAYALGVLSGSSWPPRVKSDFIK